VTLVTQDIDKKFSAIIKHIKKCNDNGLGLQDISKIKFDKNIDNLLLELFMNHLVKAEMISPGSSILLLSLLTDSTYVVTEPCVLSKENVCSLIKTYADETVTKIILDSLQLSGLYGKIVIGNHIPEGNKDVVELTNGSFFPDVYPAVNIKNSKFIDPKVVVIDGYIETVSEIHHLLEEASRLKDNIFLFVRGLSEDVVHTIKVNNNRGTLSVVPLITKYDLKGANLLNDIAVVSNSDVISTHKGQLISNIDISYIKRVDSIVVNESGVLIENKKTNSNVDRHIKFLQKRIIDAGNEAESEIISSRLKNLGSSRVTIFLKQDTNKSKRSFMIDQSLRAIKVSSTHGIVSFNGKTYPLTSLKTALHYQQKFNELVDSVGCLVCQ